VKVWIQKARKKERPELKREQEVREKKKEGCDGEG
jgi:hypothetical protein